MHQANIVCYKSKELYNNSICCLKIYQYENEIFLLRLHYNVTKKMQRRNLDAKMCRSIRWSFIKILTFNYCLLALYTLYIFLPNHTFWDPRKQSTAPKSPTAYITSNERRRHRGKGTPMHKYRYGVKNTRNSEFAKQIFPNVGNTLEVQKIRPSSTIHNQRPWYMNGGKLMPKYKDHSKNLSYKIFPEEYPNFSDSPNDRIPEQLMLMPQKRSKFTNPY